MQITKMRMIDGAVWVEAKLDDGWRAQARLDEQTGRLVVAEIKVSPGTLLPVGGITQAVLRSIACGSFAPYVLAQRSLAGQLKIGGVLEHFDRTVGARLPAIKTMNDRPRPRRDSGRDDLFFAIIAHDYLTLNAAGSRSPIKDLATARQMSAARMRDMVREARERGLLEMSKSGVRGGRLTPLGERVLRTATSQARPRRKDDVSDRLISERTKPLRATKKSRGRK